MNLRYTSKYLLGASAMLALGAAVAFGQDTTGARPTSTRRIPISKEGPGPGRAAPGRGARVDTVTLFKTDTLRINTPGPTVHDTVRVPGPSVTVHDTVQVAAPPVPIRLPGGLYFGLAAGVSAPNGAIFTPNSAGPAFQGQIGWQGAKQMLGVRGDVNWARLGEDSRFSQLGADSDILNFSADAKLQLPFLTHMFGATHRFGLYGIGGYTYTRYRNLPMRIDDPNGGNGVVFIAGTPEWQSQGGWNAGGGASLSWGRTEIFIETRVLSFDPSNAPQSRQMPFMFGLNWF